MRDRKKAEKIEATVAPGMDDKEELNQEASQAEVEKGEYTEVTRLSLDETDPS